MVSRNLSKLVRHFIDVLSHSDTDGKKLCCTYEGCLKTFKWVSGVITVTICELSQCFINSSYSARIFGLM